MIIIAVQEKFESKLKLKPFEPLVVITSELPMKRVEDSEVIDITTISQRRKITGNKISTKTPPTPKKTLSEDTTPSNTEPTLSETIPSEIAFQKPSPQPKKTSPTPKTTSPKPKKTSPKPKTTSFKPKKFKTT